MKFKVGDKVRVVNPGPHGDHHGGYIATIYEINGVNVVNNVLYPYQAKYDDYKPAGGGVEHAGFNDSHIELVIPDYVKGWKKRLST